IVNWKPFWEAGIRDHSRWSWARSNARIRLRLSRANFLQARAAFKSEQQLERGPMAKSEYATAWLQHLGSESGSKSARYAEFADKTELRPTIESIAYERKGKLRISRSTS